MVCITLSRICRAAKWIRVLYLYPAPGEGAEPARLLRSYMPAAQFLDLPESRFRASRAVCVLLVPPRRNHRAYSVLSYSSYESW